MKLRARLRRTAQSRRSDRLSATGLLLVVLLLVGGSVPPPASAGPAKKYLTIGIRGSGEPKSRNGHRNLGEPNQAALNTLFGSPTLHRGNSFYERVEWPLLGQPHLTNGDVTSTPKMDIESLPYRAIPTNPNSWFRCTEGHCGPPIDYFASVGDGADQLVSDIAGRLHDRHDAKILILGYSQGSQVFDEAVPRLARYAASIAGVLLFGDPLFRASSTTDAGPDYEPRTMIFDRHRNGLLGAGSEYPAALRSKILSWCRAGDPICQRPSTLPPYDFTPHMSYTNAVDAGAGSLWLQEHTVLLRKIERQPRTADVTVTAFKQGGIHGEVITPLPGVTIAIRKYDRYTSCDFASRVTGNDGIAHFGDCPMVGPGSLWVMPQATCPGGLQRNNLTYSYGGNLKPFGLRAGHTTQLRVLCLQSP